MLGPWAGAAPWLWVLLLIQYTEAVGESLCVSPEDMAAGGHGPIDGQLYRGSAALRELLSASSGGGQGESHHAVNKGRGTGQVIIDGRLWDEHEMAGLENGYLIVPILSAGLGNRLRLMASALQLAQDSGRACVILWFPSSSCNASFTDLFARPPPLHPPAQRGNGSSGESAVPSPWWGLVVMEELHSPFALAMARLFLNDSATSLEYQGLSIPTVDITNNLVVPPELLRQAAFPLVLLRASTGIYFSDAFQPCSSYYRRKSALYRSLVPAPAVQRLLEGIAQEHGLPEQLNPTGVETVGLHIRDIVLQHDTPEVEFAGGRHWWNESAPLDHFLDAMAHVLSSQGEPSTRPVRFVVASNSAEVLQALRQRFATLMQRDPGRLLLIQDLLGGEEQQTVTSLQRDSVAGMQRALLDMLILSRCSLVLHPFASSFAEEAAQWHLRPSLQLLFGLLLRGVDTADGSRYCNKLRFVTEARMLVDPTLSEAQARALEVEACPGGHWRGLLTLCLPVDNQLLARHASLADGHDPPRMWGRVDV